MLFRSYDEDKDYERRVGRQSGHSLIEPNAVKVIDPIRPKDLPADATYIGPVKVEDTPSFKPTEVQRVQLEAIMELAKMKIEDIKEILRFYTEQNKALTEMSAQTQLPKSAQKTQETVNKIIQKYMNEMSKTLL